MGMNYIKQKTRQAYFVFLQTSMVSRSRLTDQKNECLGDLLQTMMWISWD